MWTIFRVFIEFVTILLLFHVLVFWLRGMWDLSSPTRDRTCTPCIGRRSLNHWTAREVPLLALLKMNHVLNHILKCTAFHLKKKTQVEQIIMMRMITLKIMRVITTAH